MPESPPVLEYKCPCCGAGLVFDQKSQKMSCRSCGNSFATEDVQQYYEAQATVQPGETEWARPTAEDWSEEEQQTVRVYTCPSCGGELITDGNTAATFCPFCENPAILPGRLSGELRPDGVLPFRTTREDAKTAYRNLCKKKPLLPKLFTQEQRVEKITGMYVPYWLYDCGCSAQGRYRATRTTTWSDRRYIYTKTDTYLLLRAGSAAFQGVPMDGSQKMNDDLMESLEPYDYSQLQPFGTGYLSGFLADKFDVPEKAGHQRIHQRVQDSMDNLFRQNCAGQGILTPVGMDAQLHNCTARYVLLPVWMLYTRYRDKTYVFAMNGQTGKITGTLPVSVGRSWAWFGGVAGGVAAIAMLLQMLL